MERFSHTEAGKSLETPSIESFDTLLDLKQSSSLSGKVKRSIENLEKQASTYVAEAVETASTPDDSLNYEKEEASHDQLLAALQDLRVVLKERDAKAPWLDEIIDSDSPRVKAMGWAAQQAEAGNLKVTSRYH